MNEISITRAEMVPATSVRRVSATVPQTIALRVAGLPSVRPSGSAGQGSRTSNGISECLANTGKSQRRRHTWVRAGSGDIRRGSSVSRRRQVVLREYYGQLRNADAGRERGVRTMVERNLIPRQRTCTTIWCDEAVFERAADAMGYPVGEVHREPVFRATSAEAVPL